MGPWTAENECLIKCMRLQKGWNAWQIMREFPLRNSKKTCWTILLEKFTKPKVRDLDCVKWVRTTSSEQTSQELMNKAIDQWLDSIAFRWSFALKDAFAIRQRYLICVETDLQFVTHARTHTHTHTHTHTLIVSVCFHYCLNYLSNLCRNVYWSNFRTSSGSCHLVRKYLIQKLAFWLGSIALQYRPCFWRTVYIPCSLGVSVRCLWTREHWSARLGYAEFFSPRPPQGRLHFSAYPARGVALPFIIFFALTKKSFQR